MPLATVSDSDLLRPDVIRNEMVETVDQMERIQMGGDGTYASAASTFPLINLDDPNPEYYTFGGATNPMSPTGFAAESPVGTLSLPSKEDVSVEAYKKKLKPDKGVETHLSNVPYSVFSRAVSKLQLKIWLTREQIAWRGDSSIEGLIGPRGGSAHSEIPTRNVNPVSTPWSDSANASPYDNVSELVFSIVDNGYLGAQQNPVTMYGSPGAIRDMMRTDDMENRISNVRVQNVQTDDLLDILDEDLGRIRRVNVRVPRTNADGEMIDSSGTVVDDVDEAQMDNVLDPWDPSADSGSGAQVRNVVIGRPGPGSAYMPWFLDRLTELTDEVPPTGEVSIDETNGFFTQVWSTHDPIGQFLAAKQEVGMHVRRGSNWSVLRGV
jgi:hypothetical protein